MDGPPSISSNHNVYKNDYAKIYQFWSGAQK